MKRMIHFLIGGATPIVGMFAWAYAHYVLGVGLYEQLYWPLAIALVVIGVITIDLGRRPRRLTALHLLLLIPTMFAASTAATLIVGCRFEACL